MEVDRDNLLQGAKRTPYVADCLNATNDVIIAATDYSRSLPLSVAKWIDKPFFVLGTDGFGKSEGRTALRDYFEVDRRYIALAALDQLTRAGKLPESVAAAARADFAIKADKLNPLQLHWG
jgi:pyruvate dehydrogenase E1 component